MNFCRTSLLIWDELCLTLERVFTKPFAARVLSNASRRVARFQSLPSKAREVKVSTAQQTQTPHWNPSCWILDCTSVHVNPIKKLVSLYRNSLGQRYPSGSQNTTHRELGLLSNARRVQWLRPRLRGTNVTDSEINRRDQGSLSLIKISRTRSNLIGIRSAGIG
jgi:hypothetical protein